MFLSYFFRHKTNQHAKKYEKISSTSIFLNSKELSNFIILEKLCITAKNAPRS
jgi:hypothetical protein